MKTVQILVNIGTNDMPRLQLEEQYLEGDVVELEDHVADRLIREKIAREWTEDVQRAEEQRRRLVHESQVRAVMPEAERQLAIEDAKKEAAEIAKSPEKATAARREALRAGTRSPPPASPTATPTPGSPAPAGTTPTTPSTITGNPHSPPPKTP